MGLKEIAANFFDMSFQTDEPKIQQQTMASKYIIIAHHFTQPCSSKGLTMITVVFSFIFIFCYNHFSTSDFILCRAKAEWAPGNIWLWLMVWLWCKIRSVANTKDLLCMVYLYFAYISFSLFGYLAISKSKSWYCRRKGDRSDIQVCAVNWI